MSRQIHYVSESTYNFLKMSGRFEEESKNGITVLVDQEANLWDVAKSPQFASNRMTREKRYNVLLKAKKYFWLTSLPVIKWFLPYHGLCTYRTKDGEHIARADKDNLLEWAMYNELYNGFWHSHSGYWFPVEDAGSRYALLKEYIKTEFDEFS